MSRPYRLQGEGFFYHITSRGDDRKKIFLNSGDTILNYYYVSLSIELYYGTYSKSSSWG